MIHNSHPYALKSVKMCSSISELEAIDEASNGIPMAVLASGANLDCGPARDLLLKFADNPDNAVILTDSQRCVPRPSSMFSNRDKNTTGNNNNRMFNSKNSEEDANGAGGSTLGNTLSLANTNPYSSAAQLLLKWCQAKEAHQEMADVVEIDVLVPHRAPLVGDELNSFLQQEEAARQEKKAQEERKALLREVELARGRLRLGEEDVEENVGGGTGTGNDGGAPDNTKDNNSASNNDKEGKDSSKDIASEVSQGNDKNKGKARSAKPPPKKKSRFDQNLFLKFSKPVHSKSKQY